MDPRFFRGTRRKSHADFAIASLATSRQAFMSSIGLSGLASYSSDRAPSAGNLTAEGLEEADDVEVSLADDDVVALGRVRLLFVLDVHAIDALAQLQHALDRVLAAAEIVAAIDAGPDPLVAALHRLRHAAELVEQGVRPVVVNRDPDVVLGDQLLQAVEAVRSGLAVITFTPAFLAKSNSALFLVVVLREAVNAVAGELDLGRLPAASSVSAIFSSLAFGSRCLP